MSSMTGQLTEAECAALGAEACTPGCCEAPCC